MGAEASQLTDDDRQLLDSQKQREINRMDQVVRHRVRTGIQYNMKVIVRGERGTGKSTLWRRFQGMPFANSKQYQPTAEIQSATINWTFRNNCDNVKVDVWDVVDKAIKSKIPLRSAESGISTPTTGRNSIAALDSSVVDVYKDTQAVIFMVNPTARSSLDYVRLKSCDVPSDLSILVVLGFKDITASDSGAADKYVTMEEVLQVCQEIRSNRLSSFATSSMSQANAESSCSVFALEVSLLNCYGLDKLHKYLEIPFLHLKVSALAAQLQLAKAELGDVTTQMLAGGQTHEEYEQFEQRLARRIRDKSVPSSASNDVLDRHEDPGTVEVVSEEDELTESLAQLSRSNSATETQRSAGLKLQHTAQHPQSDGYGPSKAVVDKDPVQNRVEKLSTQGAQAQNRAERNDASAKSVESSKPQKFNGEAPVQKPLQPSGGFDSVVRNFQPADTSLEGFLEYSDEDDRAMHSSKMKIRQYMRNSSDVLIDSPNVKSLKSASPMPDARLSDSEEDNGRNASLASRKKDVGKLVRKAKIPVSVPVQPAPLQASPPLKQQPLLGRSVPQSAQACFESQSATAAQATQKSSVPASNKNALKAKKLVQDNQSSDGSIDEDAIRGYKQAFHGIRSESDDDPPRPTMPKPTVVSKKLKKAVRQKTAPVPVEMDF